MSHRFDLCGCHLALDFANTVSLRLSAAPIERLVSYEDLVAFAEQSGLLSEDRAARLTRWGRKKPEDAEALLRGVRELREALYRIFAGVVTGERPSPVDLALLNAWHARLRLGETFTW